MKLPGNKVDSFKYGAKWNKYLLYITLATTIHYTGSRWLDHIVGQGKLSVLHSMSSKSLSILPFTLFVIETSPPLLFYRGGGGGAHGHFNFPFCEYGTFVLNSKKLQVVFLAEGHWNTQSQLILKVLSEFD